MGKSMYRTPPKAAHDTGAGTGGSAANPSSVSNGGADQGCAVPEEVALVSDRSTADTELKGMAQRIMRLEALLDCLEEKLEAAKAETAKARAEAVAAKAEAQAAKAAAAAAQADAGAATTKAEAALAQSQSALGRSDRAASQAKLLTPSQVVVQAPAQAERADILEAIAVAAQSCSAESFVFCAHKAGRPYEAQPPFPGPLGAAALTASSSGPPTTSYAQAVQQGPTTMQTWLVELPAHMAMKAADGAFRLRRATNTRLQSIRIREDLTREQRARKARIMAQHGQAIRDKRSRTCFTVWREGLPYFTNKGDPILHPFSFNANFTEDATPTE